MEKEIIQQMGKVPAVKRTEYDEANAFVDDLVANHRTKVSQIIQKQTGKKVAMYSVESLKREIKNLLMMQHSGFVSDLSDYLVSNADLKVSTSTGGIERYVASNSTSLLNSGGSWFSDLFSRDPDKKSDKKAEKEAKKEAKAEKKANQDPFDWNKAMDTTGKVAQTIFHIGSIFSKNESEPTPTFDESDRSADDGRNNLTRNIIIGVVVVALIGTAAYFAFRTKK